ncbi:MAG: hypothetical protein DI528_03580 [Shinella sp.]|nr:MAG: hypothetical protein DI528_03580 [Shinella sp.]
MASLKSILGEAVNAGHIGQEQVSPLESFLSGKGVTVSGVVVQPSAVGGGPEGDTSVMAEDAAFETEAPRFIRGFHDILITIGLIVALVGASGLGTAFLALPLTLVLAEILVRRQRLALPAVALTIAFVISVMTIMQMVTEDIVPPDASKAFFVLIYLSPYPLLLGLFHWRYRVPLSLALAIFSLVGLVAALILAGLSEFLDVVDLMATQRSLAVSILLVMAIVLFAIAMAFDLRDPERRTRRSDVAFWLHLVTAPSLLWTMLALVFLNAIDGLSFYPEQPDAGQAALVIAIVAFFMMIGVIIDRRAFVTSGLLSLGYAIYNIFRSADLALDSYVFVTLILVGALVLTIGVGWAHIRRAIFTLLPEPLKTKLPPLR